MFDENIYAPAFRHGMLVVTIFSALIFLQGFSRDSLIRGYNTTMIWVLFFGMTLFLGTRPISGVFVDMPGYATSYNLVSAGAEPLYTDVGFNYLNELCGNILGLSVESFFLACCLLYTAPLFLATQRIHGEWGFAALLTFMGAFSFFTYGVNGIRNGIATSLLIAAFAFHDRKIAMAILMVIAAAMHKSALLPIAAFILAGLYAKPGVYAAIWTVSLAISATIGEQASGLLMGIAALGDDERLQSYIAGAGTGMDRGGFRWDFILYSIVPIIVSYSLASRTVKQSPFYRRILCTYLLSNSFWLFAIYAAQSNRFAYLSWFLMPWVIIYPFIHNVKRGAASPLPAIEAPRFALIASAIVAHYSFTYIMWVFVYANRVS